MDRTSKSKRIDNFKQFLKDQHRIKLNEAKIDIECCFWDDAQIEVMQDLRDECNGDLSWDTMVQFVKDKFSILGRPDPGFDEARLLQHIKDLIFQHHWDSFYTSPLCDWGEGNIGVQAKGLVISELANTILEKLYDTMLPSEDDPIPGVTTVSLVDREPRVLIPMQPAELVSDDEVEYFDDLPFESKRPVKGFKDYIKSSKRK